MIDGARSDPFSGYPDDGDSHWTPQLVRDWWADRGSREPLVEMLVRDLCGPRPELPTEYADLLLRCLPIGGYDEGERAAMREIVSGYLDYTATDLEGDLRRYIAYLETGGWPDPSTTLPEL